MDIKILPPDVIDQIAAGEVVERPAHLVKELVENSLDAFATKVEVDVDLGGRKLRISDNGTGIYAADLPLVCARHATSKISLADDLWKLKTYGFRGEALASIASVSKLKLISKKKGETKGYMYENHFGKGNDPLVTGAEYGTVIEVDDLFSNVPARLKFLKSDSAEVTQIKNAVKALALAYPHVEFKFKQQGKVVFFYPAEESLLERTKKVLEAKELYFAEKQFQDHTLEIAYSSPHVTLGTSKQIWIFVENRWVDDRSIRAAVMEAYRSLLMHGEYPYVVIKLKVPPGTVDVNIHPTKSQVKFTDSSFIFKFVHNSLRAELERAPWLGGMDRGAVPRVFEAPVQNMSFQDDSFEKVQYLKKSFSPQDPVGLRSQGLPELQVFPAFSAQGSEPLSTEGPCFALQEAAYSAPSEFIAPSENGPSSSTALSSTGTFWSRLQVLGQTHLTYILAEGQNSLFLIDQHAAHERVAFEKLMASFKSGNFEVQGFLIPLSLNLTAEQVDALMALKADFLKMGLEIDQAGPETLLVASAPSFVSEKGIAKSIQQFADEMIQLGGSFSFEKKVIDIFATMACHSVVRAGQSLSHEEMRSLLEQMDEFTLSSYCPHGRNVFIELPYTKIEKDFGRIN